MARKGESYAFGVLVRLIILILSTVVLMTFLFFYYKPFIIDTFNDNFCFMTVVLKTYSRQSGPIPTGIIQHIPIIGTDIPAVNSPYNLKCKMHDKTVKNKEEAKKTIAKEMANCWGRFGEGKFNFYSDIQLKFWETNNLCYVCSRIKSNNEIRLNSNEMVVYLRDKQPKPLIDKRTYLQYITGTGTQENKLLNFGDIEIKEDNPLFVLYIVNKDEGILSRFQRGVTDTATILGLELLFRRSKSTLISAAGGAGQAITLKPTVIAGQPLQLVPGFQGPGQGYTLGTPAQVIQPGISGRAAVLARTLGKGNLFFLGVAAGAGTASALLQSKGFNSNILLLDSSRVKDLCTEYAK